ATLFRICVDESDEVQPVLRMLQDLPGDELTGVAGTDDDRVLQVVDLTSAVRPRHSTAQRNESDRERPKDEKLRQVRMGNPRQVSEITKQPHAGGDHVEHTGDVFGS